MEQQISKNLSQLDFLVGKLNDDSHQHVIKEFIMNSSDLELAEMNSEGMITNSMLHWICYHDKVDLLNLYFLKEMKSEDKYPLLNMLQLPCGILKATPLHWACRQGAMEIVMFVIRYIDQECDFDDQSRLIFELFSVKDEQGFSPFTCAILSKHELMAFTIVTCCEKIELLTRLDAEKRSIFHWMGYHGIDSMVLFYADQNKLDLVEALTLVDSQGFTPLHWAACKGFYYSVLKSFITILQKNLNHAELECILNIKNEENYSVYDYARMHDKTLWLNRQLYPKSKHYASFFSLLSICSIVYGVYLPWYLYIVLFPFVIFTSIRTIQYLYAGERDTTIVQQGRYLSGLVLSTALVGLALTTQMSFYFVNIILYIMIVVMCYSLFKTWKKVPVIPLLKDELHLRNLLVTLHSKQLLNKSNICTSCVARKPLRSKHCRVTNQCVAKFDHFCPWTSSVIGQHNHRYFIVFICSLLLNIMLFLTVSIHYLQTSTNLNDPVMQDCMNGSIFVAFICNGFYNHPSMIVFMVWLVVNGIWSLFVVGSQFMLIIWNMTTNEQINQNRFEYLNHVDDKRQDSSNDIEMSQFKQPKTYLMGGRQYIRYSIFI